MTTAVLRSRDDDGRLVVGVPLSNRLGRHAWLYETDYEAILTDHGHTPWFLNDNGSGQLYVRLQSADRNNPVMVARLVMADPQARSIRYRDGDRLNLRSRNLDVRKPNILPKSRTRPTSSSRDVFPAPSPGA